MGFTERYAEFIYRVTTTRRKLRIISTPVGLIFWFCLSALFVFASLWVDELLPIQLNLSPPSNMFYSLPLLIIGASVTLWSIYTFFRARGSPIPLNPPKKLVTTGLYSLTRNPMLLGWFILLFGVGILLKSFSMIVIFIPLFICINIVYLKTIEEKEMEKKFGKEYLTYKEKVPMFIPYFNRKK